MTSITELVVPYDRGDVLAAIHREGEVLVETHEATSSRIRARLDAASKNLLREFVVEIPGLDGDPELAGQTGDEA
jgi:GTP-binding protein HflX